MIASAEAPGKAIVIGEHFVVHGAWALAAALNRKVRVDVAQSDRFSVRSEGLRLGRSSLAPISAVVEAIKREHSLDPRVSIRIRSELPEGSGLGSSASTMVAVAAAISRLNSLGLSRTELIRFAMAGETVIHGRPSGIDPTVCALGGVLLFKRGEKPKTVALVRPASLIVVYSGKKRKTRALINRVSGMKKKYPGLFQGLAQAATEVSHLAAQRLRERDEVGLGGLLTFNHAVLSAVGASTPFLDRLVDTLLTLGCTGAKMTGAGGGGSVIAVSRRGKEKSTVTELRARGFEAFQAVIPVEGVKSWLGR